MEQHSEIDDEEPVDERLTQLVSYLDGELEETQMNAFEQDLINDPEMRSHADILSRTWGLLDSLEEVSASRQFTQETMATISAEVVDDPVRSAGRLRRLVIGCARYRILPSFILGLVAASIGLSVSNRMQERREEKGDAAVAKTAMQNIDLLQQLELYDLVPDATQLKELKLAELPASSTEPVDKSQP